MKNTAFQVLEKYTPGGITGYDHEGCPVWVFCAGDFDMRGTLECLTPRELTNHLIYLLELCNEDMERQSQKVCEPKHICSSFPPARLDH